MKKKILALLLAGMLLALTGCGAFTDSTPLDFVPDGEKNGTVAKIPLPAPAPKPDSNFGIDMNINMDTIDDWLGRDDVAYRDVRLLYDPADYAAIGGDPNLSSTIEGFKIIPYPFVATLPNLPVEGAYDGDTLFTLTWNEDGSIASADANYQESMMLLEEIFPKDKAIFLMCGGAGYANMMRSLLCYLGWDKSLLYNVGGNWGYKGEHRLELIINPEAADGNIIYATWRADYALFDFAKLNPVAGRENQARTDNSTKPLFPICGSDDNEDAA